MRFSTAAVHAGQEVDPSTGAVIPPLHLAVTFEQKVQDPLKYFYGRGENPTRESLEKCLSALEGAGDALAFSSGQAAGASVFSLLKPGDEFLCSDDLYGGTLDLFGFIKNGSNISFKLVDMTNADIVEASISPATKLIWIETPTNPTLKISDISRICEIARRNNVKVLVDNTFASPYLQRPLLLGADFVLYSATKYLAGHGDVISGALIIRDADDYRNLFRYRTATGAIPSPIDCYLVQRGIKTLSIRMERQISNTKRLVDLLSNSKNVSRVIYPGLATHPQYEICKKQMKEPGAIISFEYTGNANEFMHGLEYFHCAVSLGSVFSLIECPAMMTHRVLSPEKKEALGISDRLLRLSVGIEDIADLEDDLSRFL